MKELKPDHRINRVVAGRTLDKQIECIEENGNHGLPSLLIASLLASLGIAKPNPTAENPVIFGCYQPFSNPFLIRDYLRLLDVLEIDYTYLDKEYFSVHL